LVESWSPEGDNLIWRSDFQGRSTPVVLNGRVYAMGRTGKDITEQERVACFDAGTGKLLWDHTFNVFGTTIPFNRVGWSHLAGDPETGNIYAFGVQGLFICFNKDGKILWQRSLTEEYGRISGYGGRNQTPLIDGDLAIISCLSSSWGAQAPGRHRYFAFDKRTGELVWVGLPGGRPFDTNYSTPVVAEIEGRRLLIGGNSDGGVHAMNIGTGAKVWTFKLSKRGLNTNVVIDGNRIYAAHSEENWDSVAMGRVVCFSGNGTGDITESNELWRVDGLTVGYTAPILHDGLLYVVDNSANLYCLDAESGERLWEYSLGTVGKGSPVWADGKIYATEVNGRVHIVQVSREGAKKLDSDLLHRTDDVHAEIYGSPAVGYGRVYFTTEEGIYCLGKKGVPFKPTPSDIVKVDTRAPADATPAAVMVVPAEARLTPAGKASFSARLVDDRGRFIKEVPARWTLDGITGTLEGNGSYKPDAGGQAGRIKASYGSLSATARVRVIQDIPWEESFETIDVGKHPAHWVSATGKFAVVDKDGNRVLKKSPATRGLDRHATYLGDPASGGYTIQADVMGTRPKRQMSDVGLINSHYMLILYGNHQRIQVVSWLSDLRMAKHISYKWEPDTWYTMKLKIDSEGDKAIVKGKVWKKGEAEPDTWTITAEDPHGMDQGTPGIIANSPADLYYDNIKVW